MKKWKRISISLLLFVTFCVAGFFTGIRYGASDGVEAQVEARLADRESQIYPMIYGVSDLLPSPGSAIAASPDSLIEDIRQATRKRSWQDAGGPGEIHGYPPDRIVVSASAATHSRIAAYLKGRRAGAKHRTAPSDETVPVSRGRE